MAKVTRKDMFEGIKATLIENFETEDVAEYVEFLDKELDAIAEKARKEAEKRAEKRAAGDEVRDAVKAVIDEADGPITAEAIAEKLAEDFPEITKAKVTYRASALAKDGEVVKTKIDKKYVAYAPAGYVAAEGDAE